MIDTRALKIIIFENDLSQRKVARELNISEKTFYEKMKKGIFDSDEIEKMIDLLHIKNPMKIFFTKKVTYKDTKKNFKAG